MTKYLAISYRTCQSYIVNCPHMICSWWYFDIISNTWPYVTSNWWSLSIVGSNWSYDACTWQYLAGHIWQCLVICRMWAVLFGSTWPYVASKWGYCAILSGIWQFVACTFMLIAIWQLVFVGNWQYLAYLTIYGMHWIVLGMVLGDSW